MRPQPQPAAGPLDVLPFQGLTFATVPGMVSTQRAVYVPMRYPVMQAPTNMPLVDFKVTTNDGFAERGLMREQQNRTTVHSPLPGAQGVVNRPYSAVTLPDNIPSDFGEQAPRAKGRR